MDTELWFQLGTVTKVKPETNRIDIHSELGACDIFDVELGNIPGMQIMPEVGNYVLVARQGDQGTTCVVIKGNKDNTLRKGSYSLQEGEVQYQGKGGSYLYLDNKGNVSLVDGNMVGSIKMENLERQITVEQVKVVLKTFNNISIRIGEDGDIIIENGYQDSRIKLNKDGIIIENNKTSSNIKLDSNGISLVGPSIFLDGQVYLGPGASDASKRLLFGNAVTSGPLGTYPLDFVTGTPIPGSTSVKVGV